MSNDISRIVLFLLPVKTVVYKTVLNDRSERYYYMATIGNSNKCAEGNTPTEAFINLAQKYPKYFAIITNLGESDEPDR